MATFNATALKAHVEPAPRLPGVRRGFLVFNKGKETRFIPEEARDRLVGLGVISGDPLDHDDDGRKGGSKRGAKSTRARGARKAAATPLREGDFEAKHLGFGKYEITGPGLDSPEQVKTKAAATARLGELAAGGGTDAPTE